jgi:hypothetical protein
MQTQYETQNKMFAQRDWLQKKCSRRLGKTGGKLTNLYVRFA